MTSEKKLDPSDGFDGFGSVPRQYGSNNNKIRRFPINLEPRLAALSYAEQIQYSLPQEFNSVAALWANELRRLAPMEDDRDAAMAINVALQARVRELENALRIASSHMIRRGQYLHIDKEWAIIDKALGKTK